MRVYNPGRSLLYGKHTAGQVGCPACAGAHAVLYRQVVADLLFTEASELWLSHCILETNGLRTNASYLAKKTERDYRVCFKALNRFFGHLRLEKIHPGHLMTYQKARATNPSDAGGTWHCVSRGVVHGDFATSDEAQAWARGRGGDWDIVQTLWAYPAGANCVRKEIALLIRVLRAAKLWGEEQEQYFLRLRPVESDVERAMTLEEQHRFLHVGASRMEFRFIYQYAIVALQTTAGTNEMRQLRLGDVLLADRQILISRAGAKNKYRMRSIPLVTEDAMWAMEGLLTRARELGAVAPSHYLFPFQAARTHYDPTRPMSESGLKKPWDALRKAAGLPELRLYDLRHTGITRMAEAGVPLRVTMTYAGHMTERMQQHYEAICMSAKRGWGEQVWGDGREREAMHTAAEAAGAWGTPRKPVAADAVRRYQDGQHFHRKSRA